MSKPNILLISLYDSSALSIRCLHSVLKEAKYPVEMVFLKELVYNQMKKPTEKELHLLINITNKIKPDIIAMSVRSPFFEIAKEITQLLKKETGKMMVWGGIHPTILPNESIKHADIICIGEGEEAFLELVQNLETNKDISKIKNIWIRTNGKIIKNGIRPLLENLDKIPLPEYSNGGKYYINLDTITSKDPYLDYNKYYPMAGRGCPFSCTFCINSYLNKLFKSK